MSGPAVLGITLTLYCLGCIRMWHKITRLESKDQNRSHAADTLT